MSTQLDTTQLTADAARALTDQIRTRLDGLLPLIKQAYEQRADQALGYDSWQDYCRAELGGLRVPLADRPAHVAELRQAGMSTRAIGSALGVSKSQVDRDLAQVSRDGTPDRVTGSDGKTYASTRLTPPAPPSEPDPELFEWRCLRCRLHFESADATCPDCGGWAKPDHTPDDHPLRAGEADGQLDAAEDAAASEAPTGAATPVGAADSPTPTPTVDPLDDPDQVAADHRQRSSRAVAEALVTLHMRLDPDPVRWVGDTWTPDAYRLRDMPRVRDVLTATGLRLVAKHLDAIADHLDHTGGSL